MTMSIFQRHVLDTTGAIAASPTVSVVNSNTGAVAALFADKDGATGKTNPFTGTSQGLVEFYAVGGFYDITVTKGAFTVTYNRVALGTAAGSDIEALSANVDAIHALNGGF